MKTLYSWYMNPYEDALTTPSRSTHIFQHQVYDSRIVEVYIYDDLSVYSIITVYNSTFHHGIHVNISFLFTNRATKNVAAPRVYWRNHRKYQLPGKGQEMQGPLKATGRASLRYLPGKNPGIHRDKKTTFPLVNITIFLFKRFLGRNT